MTDISQVLLLVRELSLTEASVDTEAVTDSLAALKQATLAASTGDADTDAWLSQEHTAGGMLATAAALNKRAEIAGKRGSFNPQTRATLVSLYNSWARQFESRLEAFQDGRANVPTYLRSLALFHADPLSHHP